MLSLIGIGLADPTDITLKGLDIIKKSDILYLENYTSFLQTKIDEFETLCAKKILALSRTDMENNSARLLTEATTRNVAILVIGDPLCATTHTSLLLEARQQNIPVQVVHNASVLTAVGITGLQLYNFGKTASIPFHPTDVPYETLGLNKKAGLHTLFLLDLDPTTHPHPPHRALLANDAARILLSLESRHNKNLLTPDTVAIVCERLGSSTQRISASTLLHISQTTFGNPPHSIIIPGELHFLEEEWIDIFKKETDNMTKDNKTRRNIVRKAEK